MSFPTDRPATWFVTGTSRGLGRELVTQLLQRGDQVAATTRSTERLLAALGDRVDTSRLLPLTVDLRDDEQVRQAVRQATERFGGLDVVVNNAGYGYLAAVEETSAREVRDMLDVQVGYFRTDFLTTDSLALPASTTDAYPGLREMTENHLKLQGSQLGNPVKGAEAIIRQVVSGEGPLRQLLGSDAHAYATAKVDALRANLKATAQTADATDFADA
ncbi:SDR family NAD(P)-dependent oxidoreductase [Streptomyces himastatinicus]|nr:SDR family NAD(P)-dependent oxidoreductase [Streptomyces himastatinicus]